MNSETGKNWPTDGAGKMLSLVYDFPANLRASARLPGLDSISPLGDSCSRIVFCGMGGSAIAADLVQPLLQDQGVSLSVWRDYDLPHWVQATDLVIVASYSGNTEESLSALAEARRRGCSLVGITSGGTLQAEASGSGDRSFPWVGLPGGLPPRAALGHGLGALLQVLGCLQVIDDPQPAIEAGYAALQAEAPACLSPWQQEAGAAVDSAADRISVRELASELKNRIPVLYTAGLETHAVGLRWKAQLNENSKVPVALAAFPELDHNDLVGWDLPESLRSRFVLVILESGITEPRARIRIDATRKLLLSEFHSIHRIEASGDSPLERVLSLVQYGDYLSCHLADLRGVDPVPVDRIEDLKTILSRG